MTLQSMPAPGGGRRRGRSRGACFSLLWLCLWRRAMACCSAAATSFFAPLPLPAFHHQALLSKSSPRLTGGLRMSSSFSSWPLSGKVALVTGASRGIGRGIALELALAGATVYATARSRSSADCTEGEEVGGSLEGLEKEVAAAGGVGRVVGVQCDHRRDEEVKGVLERIQREQGKRLHLLVNNAFQVGDVSLVSGTRPFWEQGAEAWDLVITVGLRSHYVAACLAAPLLIHTAAAAAQEAPPPLIVNIGSFGGVSYIFNVAYGVGKAGVDRLTRDTAIELKPHGVACLSLWPGIVLTERMAWMRRQDPQQWADLMGVTDDRYVESPRFTGRVIAKLMMMGPGAGGEASSVSKKTGTVQVVAELARELGVYDPVSGLQPPSIRSLQFLLPNYLGLHLPTWLPVPDLRLPLWLMTQRPE